MLKKVFLISIVVAVAACGSKPRVNLDEIAGVSIVPNAEHGIIAKDVANLFETYSYKKVPLGDSISSIIFDNMLKAMDDGKNYLLQSDVDEFEPYRTRLAQDIKKGDLSAAFHMFNVYVNRYLERMDTALAQIEGTHDFTVNETYVYNRADEDWFASDTEAADQWRKRVKYDLINLRLSSTSDGDDAAKHQKTLRDRYNNLISQVKKTNNNEAFQIIMGAFTNAIDPHTNYFNPYFAQQFNEGMSNTMEGIGAQLTLNNEVVTVTQVVPGGPVFKEKALQIDDRIIAVAQGVDGEFEDIIGWRLDHSVAKIKGPKGTVVRLKVIPAGQELTVEPKIVTLTREKIVLEEESAKREIKEVVAEDGKKYKVGIINIPKFYIDWTAYSNNDPDYKSTTRDVRLLIDSLKRDQVDAILVDLRFNGGGSLLESVELTGLFIDQGPVVQVRDVRNQVQVHRDELAGVAWDGPMGVIINRFSASASEIFAGAIQDYGRGIILGTQSYGKGTVQSAVDMGRVISRADRLLLQAKSEGKEVIPEGAPRFGQINITMAKFYRVTGSSTQHKGVVPDLTFPSMYAADKYGESSEPSALPWDQIKPVSFQSTQDLSNIINKLEQNHDSRMKGSPEYSFLLDDIQQAEKREKENSVTLLKTKLQEERNENQAKNRERVNALLKIRGLPLWEEGKPQPKVEVDFIKDESISVMGDYLSLLASGEKQTASTASSQGGR